MPLQFGLPVHAPGRVGLAGALAVTVVRLFRLPALAGVLYELAQRVCAEIDVTEDEFDAMMAESEPVEVTGPFDPARRVRFELISGKLHNYRWRLVAANGEILATSAASYRSLEDARRALSALTVAMQNAPIVDADDPVSHRRAS